MVRREAKGAKVDIPGLPSPKLGAGGNFYSLSSLHSVKLPHLGVLGCEMGPLAAPWLPRIPGVSVRNQASRVEI